MRSALALLAFGVAACLVSQAQAGPILDRIKAAKVVRCGGVERPGLMDIEEDGKAHGLELDLCRAIASVVLGPGGRLEFTNYNTDKAFAAARAGHEDVMFLTGREMVENGLTGQVIPGPAIFIETISVMVQDDAPLHRLEDLAGKPICFSLGGHAQFHLQSWFAEHHLAFQPMAFQEDGEMNDAYKVKYCTGLAGETTTLADTAQSAELGDRKNRILPDVLAAYPILATSSTSDGEWAAIVAWTLETLKRADAPTSHWVRGGFESMPVEAPGLGLEKGWQAKLVGLMGGYGQLFDKNLGAGSPLRLDRGANSPVMEKGAFAAPYVD